VKMLLKEQGSVGPIFSSNIVLEELKKK